MPEQRSRSDSSGLVAKGITRSFKDNLVVRGVSLRVDRGEVVGLIGPNGAGKSTCFAMLFDCFDKKRTWMRQRLNRLAQKPQGLMDGRAT